MPPSICTGSSRLSRQHFRRRGPSGPKRFSANRGLALPGEALSPDADAILQRPAVALREIELPFACVDRKRASRLARGVVDLLAGRAGHVDFIVEASRRRIVRIRVRRQKGLRIGSGGRSGQTQRKIEEILRRRVGGREAQARNADQEKNTRPTHRLTPLEQPASR